MATELRNISEEYQKLGQNGFDATMRSYGEADKGLHPVTDVAVLGTPNVRRLKMSGGWESM